MINNMEDLARAFAYLNGESSLNALLAEKSKIETEIKILDIEMKPLRFYTESSDSLSQYEINELREMDPESFDYMKSRLSLSLLNTYKNQLVVKKEKKKVLENQLKDLNVKIDFMRQNYNFVFESLTGKKSDIKTNVPEKSMITDDDKDDNMDTSLSFNSAEETVKKENVTSIAPSSTKAPETFRDFTGIVPDKFKAPDIPDEENKKKVVIATVPTKEKPEEVADGMFSKTDDEEDEQINDFKGREKDDKESFLDRLNRVSASLEDEDTKDRSSINHSFSTLDGIKEEKDDDDGLFLGGAPRGYEEATYAEPKPSLFKGDKFKKLLAAAGAALVGLGVFKSPPYHPKGTPTQIEQEADNRTGDVLVQYPTPTLTPTPIPTPTPTVQPTYNPGDIPYDPGYVNPGPTTIEDEIIPEENPEELPPVVEEEIIVDPETGDPINNPENPDNNDEPTVPEDETVTEDIIVDPETGEPIGPTEEPTNPGNDEEPTIPEDDTVTEEIIVDPETGDPIVNPEPVAEPEAPVLDTYESAFDYNTQVEVTHGSETYDEANNTTGSADLEYDNQGLAHTEEVDYQNVLPESAPAEAEEIASAPEAPAYEAPAPETPVYEAPVYEAPAVEAPVAELPQSYDSLVEQAQYDQGAAEVVQAVDEFDWDSLFESEFGDGMSR